MNKLDSADPDVLWVVVHGMIAMWDDSENKKLRLLLPDVPHHAYGAGSFQNELTLEVHDYRLVVPNPGSSLDLDQNQDPILVGGDFDPPPVPQPQNARHVITLPYPDYTSADQPIERFAGPILRLRLSTGENGGSAIQSGGVRMPDQIPLVYAFGYSGAGEIELQAWQQSADPELGEWLQVWQANVESSTLHIWAEECFKIASDHALKAFYAVNGLFFPNAALVPGDKLLGDPDDQCQIPVDEQRGLAENRSRHVEIIEASDCWAMFVRA